MDFTQDDTLKKYILVIRIITILISTISIDAPWNADLVVVGNLTKIRQFSTDAFNREKKLEETLQGETSRTWAL